VGGKIAGLLVRQTEGYEHMCQRRAIAVEMEDGSFERGIIIDFYQHFLGDHSSSSISSSSPSPASAASCQTSSSMS
jgi:hypothetical protein